MQCYFSLFEYCFVSFAISNIDCSLTELEHHFSPLALVYWFIVVDTIFDVLSCTICFQSCTSGRERE